MKRYEQPTIEPLASNPEIYVLRDSHGNLMGAGSPDVLEVLLHMSRRCVRAIAHPQSALILTPVKVN